MECLGQPSVLVDDDLIGWVEHERHVEVDGHGEDDQRVPDEQVLLREVDQEHIIQLISLHLKNDKNPKNRKNWKNSHTK